VEAVPTINKVVFTEVQTRTLHIVDPTSTSSKIPTQLYAAVNVVPSAIAVDRFNGYEVQRSCFGPETGPHSATNVVLPVLVLVLVLVVIRFSKIP